MDLDPSGWRLETHYKRRKSTAVVYWYNHNRSYLRGSSLFPKARKMYSFSILFGEKLLKNKSEVNTDKTLAGKNVLIYFSGKCE